MKDTLTTVIEITDAHVKFLQGLMSAGRLHLTRCEVKRITQHSDEEISRILSEFLASSRSRVDNVIGIVPRRFAIQRHIELPSHDDAEIEKMVSLQIIKRVPYPKEDIVVDYTVLRKDPSGYVKVLVIAVHKDVIGRYLKIFSAAGLHANRLTLSVQGLLNFTIFENEKSKPRITQPVVMVHIDHMHTEICFVEQERLLFSRSIHYGAKDLQEDLVPAFVHQIHLTINAYMKEKLPADIAKIFLLSPLKEAEILKSRLETEYQMPMVVIDPLGEIPLKKKISFPQIVLQDGISLGVGLGMFFGRHRRMINLLPEEVRDTRKTRLRKRQWAKLIGLAAATLGLLIAVFSLSTYKKSVYLRRLEDMIQETDKKVADIKGRAQRLDALKEKLSPQVPVIMIINELYDITPGDVSFRTIQLEENRSFLLRGVAKNSATINELQKKLVQSRLFENVTLQYATKRKVFRGQELTDFKIICQVAGGNSKGQ